MIWINVFIGCIIWIPTILADSHTSGTCSLYGNCGKKSLFGSELPCPSTVEAVIPDKDSRDLLIEVCGSEFEFGPVCCDKSQINALKSDLKKAENIISSCPACKQNFFNLFCRFTCSPDQSTFVNVTKTAKSMSGKDIVTELDHYIDEEKAQKFYDSCKEVKFSATNGYAMDLIGGGAKDYKAFLKFLGDEKPLLGGSPFQMNFPWNNTPDVITRQNGTVYSCSDESYKCSCTDCDSSCPELPDVKQKKSCKIGILPCLSFAVLLTYTIIAACVLIGYIIYNYLARHAMFGIGSVSLFDDGNPHDYDQPSIFPDSDRLKEPYKLNTILQRFFSKLAFVCASFPRVIIFSTMTIVLVLSLGMFNVSLERDPAKLWVSSSSMESQEKTFFDTNFGPFYRSQQLYLINDTGPVLSYDTLKWWFSVENYISNELDAMVEDAGGVGEMRDGVGIIDQSSDSNGFSKGVSGGSSGSDKLITSIDRSNDRSESIDRLIGGSNDRSTVSKDPKPLFISFNDICFKPADDSCVIESITQYFGGQFDSISEKNWKEKVQNCANSPVSCLPPFQQPLKPSLLFGGSVDNDILTSKALVVTWIVNNDVNPDSKQVKYASAWENVLESYLLNVSKQAESRGLRISFNTEISLEKELNKSSNSDASIIIASYLFMFLYASLALGGVLPGLSSSSLVKTKFSLGLFGIAVVLSSVTASVGIFATLGVKATLIIAEVIPFLVLAVGVDNIFLLCHELDSVSATHPNESVAQRVSMAVGRIGPSILLSSSCETLAFAVAANVSMPAVKNFAIYSAGAVFLNSVLQLTIFVSAMALDQQRIDDNRVDCIPCIHARKKAGSRELFSALTARIASPNEFEGNNEPAYSRLVRRHYAPYLLNSKFKPFIIAFFVLWTSISIALFPRIELGLDQRLAVPRDSYLVDYFEDLYRYFDTGPPVYFVAHGDNFDVTKRSGQQQLCGRFSTCEQYSLVNVIEQERKRPEISYIVDPAASWIDDYLQWLNPDLDECCRFRKGTNGTEMCSPHASPRSCEVCYLDRQWDSYMHGFPEGDEFMRYFRFWISSPSDPCPLGGKAPYGTSIHADYSSNKILASNFRSSHSPLRSQADFINSYAAARRISREISQSTELDVFPYSPHYIFFAQYSTIIKDSLVLIGQTVGAAFILATIMLASFRTALLLAITVIMIVINVVGVMAIWGVGLNAVSLVNLVICVGIGVEFCIHVARTFTYSFKVTGGRELFSSTRNDRAFNALVNVGGSVFGGIALTKLIGVSVLAFTQSKIFEVYYFRIWAGLVVVATTHSLAFFPVALTYAGGSGYIVEPGSQGVPEDLASRLNDEGYHDY